MIDFTKRMTPNNMADFARYIRGLQREVGFKVSARGWCYLLEGERVINKDQFSKVEGWINRCRKAGHLPIDFVADESARAFSGVEHPDDRTPTDYFTSLIENVVSHASGWYTPDWWENEQYYIQMIVEKVDLVTLFKPVCRRYHIPIANSKGWSSMYQRAEYAKRFYEAEDKGLQPVLLYCGDHDPDGLRISEFLRKNLDDLRDVVWSSGHPGYDPYYLKIDRFGLNYDFIEDNNLTWIDNLITGSGRNLASPNHPNHDQLYVQEYLLNYGARKCEANAIVTMPNAARELAEQAIVFYVGDGALARFAGLQKEVRDEIENFKAETGLQEVLEEILN